MSKLVLNGNDSSSLIINTDNFVGSKVIDPNDMKYIRNTIKDLSDLDGKLVDGDIVFVKGYHEVNDGGEGTFIYLSAGSKGDHNGGTVIDTSKIFPNDWNDESLKNYWFNTNNTGTGVLNRFYNESVDVSWFGAKGDGATNDTLALQKSINSFSKIKLSGTHYITDVLILKDNTNISNGTLKSSDNITLLYAKNVSRININSINIIGSNVTSGIYIDSVRDPLINNVKIDEIYNGIVIETITNINNSTRNGLIKDININTVYNIGINVQANVHDMQFNNIFIAEQSAGGSVGINIDSTGSNGSLYGGNKISDSTILGFSNSLKLTSTHETWISDFIADTASEDGVYITNSCERIFFNNLWASSCVNNGITVEMGSTTNPSNVIINGYYAHNNNGVDLRVGNTSGVDNSYVLISDYENITTSLGSGSRIEKSWNSLNDGVGSGLDTDLIRGLPGDFTCGKNSSGYQILPSGIIIQWGEVSIDVSANTSTSYTFNLPIAFPNASLQAYSTAGNNLGQINTIENLTSTSVGGYCEFSSDATLIIRIFAIGY